MAFRMVTALQRRALKCALLAATSLTLAVPAAAADRVEALESRMSALEGRLDRILMRLETGGAQLTAEEARTLQDAGKILRQGADSAAAPVLIELETPGGIAAQTPLRTREKTEGFRVGDTQFGFTGFVKLDASFTDFSSGDLPSSSLGRDFYIPGLVPVGGEGDGADFDFNPRETRFIFTMDSERGGREIGGKLEFDFQVTNDGNERVSNSYTPRMRQAYVTIDNWLFGQAWSTFQDVSALPDNLDFIGPTEGTVFIRQPMVRYTKGPFQIALEQPETTVTTSAGARLLPGDDIAPDAVVRYGKKGDWGHFAAAGIVRALHIEDELVPGAVEDTAIGYGLSLSGKLNAWGKNDFRFMATAGEGLGRYIGVNIVNDAAVDARGELDPIETYSGFASYRHFWTPKWRSSLTGGYFAADNPVELVGDGTTDRVYSVHANIIHSPVDKIDIGFEYIYSNRRLDSGLDGDMNKFQFSTKYSF
ncbi:MAG: DcaP family trimeric outer membrane transporter [Pseudomonadota bacterium]